MALKAFAGNMEKFFATPRSVSTPPRKKAGSSEAATQEETQPATKEWVKTGLGAALEAMGNAVEERIVKTEKDFEEKNATIHKRLEEQSKRIEQLEARKVPEHAGKDWSKEVAEVKKQVEEAALAASQPQAAQHERIAIMGNLGWDTKAEELEKRCKDTLQAADIPPEKILAVASTRTEGGSACEVMFDASDTMEEAKLKVKAARKSFGTKLVWLDKKRSASENRPARMMHRCHDFLEKAELERSGGPRKVEKKPQYQTVKVDDKVVGYPKDGEWLWCSNASGVLGEEVMQMAKAYAEGQ